MISRPKGIHGTDFSKKWRSIIKCPSSSHASRVLSATSLWLSSHILPQAEGCTWLSWLRWGWVWAAGALPTVQEWNPSLRGTPKANIAPVLFRRAISPKWVLWASTTPPSSCNLRGWGNQKQHLTSLTHPTLPWFLPPSSPSRRCANLGCTNGTSCRNSKPAGFHVMTQTWSGGTRSWRQGRL